MATFVKSVTDIYDEYMESGDPRVTDWFLMSGPGPTLMLVFIYILFVKKIGPAYMRDKKPYDLRYTMILYNLILVLLNFYLILQTFLVFSVSNNGWFCRIDNKSDPNSLWVAKLGWWFYFIKFVEFADTAFLVLRKKTKQISTLHVFHHSIVPIAVWGGFRVEPASYNYFFPLLNSIVHTVMYSYYGLAALGPRIQKYLWWKKYLTTLQMIQFVAVFFYMVSLVITNCQVSKFVVYLNAFLAVVFLAMFYDYFQNAYLKNNSVQKEVKLRNGQANENAKTNGVANRKREHQM